MGERLERAASAALAVAALAIAAVIVHREFFERPAPLERPVRELEPVSNWGEILSVGRLIGDSAAPVKIVEFGDLECPFCGRFHETVRSVRQKYPNEVAFVFVHLPLPNHRFARPAARAVECASRVGKFAELLDLLYQKQDSLGLKSWTAFAHESNIRDTVSFAQCVRDTVALPAVEQGVAMATALGITGTPTILINGWRYGAPPQKSALESNIRDLLSGKQPFAVAVRR